MRHLGKKANSSTVSSRDDSLADSPAGPSAILSSEANASYARTLGVLDVWMLGITIVIGGQYFSWNAGLSAGIFGYFTCFLLVAGGYITLCSCTAEITGALPFAGGAYGLSRCTLGFFPGYFIGCCEALEYIVYVSTTVLAFSDMVVGLLPALVGYEPAIWLVFYLTALFFHIRGGRPFWTFNMVIGTVSILTLVAYCLGSLAFVNFAKVTKLDPHAKFTDGFAGFLRSLPTAAWFFVGVEALSLTSDDVGNPKVIVPRGHVRCVYTLAATGIVTYFVTVSLPRDGGLDELTVSLLPLTNGFQLLFHFSESMASLISLPATYATGFGFIWCYGKLIHAMATSRLLPPGLADCSDRYGTPHAALIAGSVLGYAICFFVYFVPSVSSYLFGVCITSAFCAYTGQCIGYISLKKQYRNIKSSEYQSPYGIPGALFSMSVWLMGIISICFFQQDYGEIQAFLGLAAILVIFYYSYAKKRQTFSPQENKVLLIAHVMKFNSNRSKGRKKKQVKSSNATRTSSKNSKLNKKVHCSSKKYTPAGSTGNSEGATGAKESKMSS